MKKVIQKIINLFISSGIIQNKRIIMADANFKTYQNGNKKYVLLFKPLLVIFVALFFLAQQSRGQTIIASWNFEFPFATTNTGTTPIISGGSAVANAGVQTAGSLFSSVHANAATVWSTPSGNGSFNSLASTAWGIGDYFEFKASTIGQTGIQIEWDQTSSSSGPRDFIVRYSTDGINFTTFGGSGGTYLVKLNGTAFQTWNGFFFYSNYHYLVDLTSIAALNNQPAVYIRLFANSNIGTNGSAVTTSGSSRVDNFTFLGPPCLTPAPTVTSPVIYCKGATASALSATGTSLLWYTVASGGTGSSTAPTPSTTNNGTTNYYVSQNLNGCEGSRALIAVTVNSPGTPSVSSPVNYCLDATPSALTATGSNLLWYTVSSGGTGSSTAPVPFTAILGATSYYVSQTVSGCEGSRATINVNVSITNPPFVSSPISYCKGVNAIPLSTSGGTNILWYAVASGGVGSSTAPTPSTANGGTTNYYVSQTSSGCESARATIIVNVVATTPPSVTSPVNYCKGATPSALTATGSNLKWYTVPSAGTGAFTAPTPSTAVVGTTSYYVSQAGGGCESTRATIEVNVNASTFNAITITGCDSFNWVGGTGLTYATSGTYLYSYNNASNCASVDTLKLTINYATHSVSTQTACDSYQWPANSITYTQSGTYIKSYTNAANCPSADTLHLTINYGTYNSLSISTCVSYEWTAGTGLTYTTSGTYLYSYNNGINCPSVDTLNLIINDEIHNSTTDIACESYLWAANNVSYTQSGTYIYSYNNANGCPSVDTLNITINHGTFQGFIITACENFTWTSGTGLTYTVSGVYLYPYTNSENCPSTDTLILTVNYGTHEVTTKVACEEYTWSSGTGLTYSVSGTYLFSYTKIGCPSVDTLYLTINNNTFSQDTVVACENYLWDCNGQNYTTSGDYTCVTSILGSGGCTNTATLHLTIYQNTISSETVTACESYTWPCNNQVYTASGDYTCITPIANSGNPGCVNTATLHLTISLNTITADTIVACEDYNWSCNSQNYTVSGDYICITQIPNSGNPSCENTATLHLTVNYGTHIVTSETACDSYTWTAGTGNTYTTSGTYVYNYNDVSNGCPSADTLHLTINYSTHNVTFQTACESYAWTAGTGYTYTTSGTYVYEYSNPTNGCLSADTLHLTVNYASHFVSSITACNKYTWSAGSGITYTTSGTYFIGYNNPSNGCPSADTLILTINYSTHNVTTETSCDSYTWVSGTGITYTATGTYLYHYNNSSNGCPSADTLYLTITNSIHIVTTETACESYNWATGTGITYTTSGIYMYEYNNPSNGCPSVDTLYLTINYGSHDVITLTSCDEFTWSTGTGSTYTTSGTYVFEYNNATNGCASADTLHLIINYGTHNVTTQTSCDSYTWTSGSGDVLNASGTYIYEYNDPSNGCPSADTLYLTINKSTHIVTTITSCDNYTWTDGTGMTYSTSGTYVFDYNNASNGCPSADTLHLTINNSTHLVANITSCDSYSWTAGTGSTYTTSGTYVYEYNNVTNGCASADTLHLTINYSTHNVSSQTACEDYTWSAGTGLTYTTSGTYLNNYTNGVNCPSVDTLHLTINFGTHNVLSQTICESYTWSAGTGLTYTSSGTYLHNYTNGLNCASVDTLHLIITNGTNNASTQTSCESYTWSAGTGLTYTTSGTYLYNYSNGVNCSSVDTLYLTINVGTHNASAQTACEDYTWSAGTGVTYTTSGTYLYNYTNGVNCPSVDTLHLTINSGTHNVLSQTICESYTWSAGTGLTYTSSGTYLHNYTNGLNCASVDTLHLIITNGTNNASTQTSCESYTWSAGTGLTYTTSGTYLYNYSNGVNCSSVDTLYLTINVGTHNASAQTACEDYTWSAGTGVTYTTSGTYLYNYTNGVNCPSVDTLHLTINSGTHNVLSQTICESYTWSAGTGLTYTSSGTYLHSYTNGLNCASVDTLHLIITNGTNNASSQTACEDYTWSAGTGLTYTTSGTYLYNYSNGLNCSSVDTLYLTINVGTHNASTQTACEDYTWSAGTGLTYTTSGTYLYSYTNNVNCPSVDTLHLTINFGTHNVLSQTICESYTWSAGTGLTYTSSGTYLHNYTNGFNCASVDTLHLTIRNGASIILSQTSCDSFTWTAGTGNTYTASGTYFFQNNNASNGCNAVDTLYLTINYSTHNVLNAASCNSYTWSAGTGSIYTASGTYVYLYSNASNGCASADTLHLTINYGTHNATAENSCNSFTWTAGTGNTYTASGTYIYSYSNANGCLSADTLHLIIDLLLPAPAVISPVEYCQGAAASALSAGAGNFLWYTTETGGIGNVTAPTPSTSATGITSYWVSKTTNGCESKRAEIVVMVHENPAKPIASNNGPVCEGLALSLNTPVVLGATCNWSGPNNFWSTLDNPTVSNLATTSMSGVYYLNLSNQFGCESEVDSTVVVVNALPTVVISGNLSFCTGGSTTLDAGIHVSYIWSTGATTQTITATTAGLYAATVSDANGCTASSAVTVVVDNVLNPEITGSTVLCSGQSTILNAGNYANCLWSTGATTQTISANSPGTFTVMVTNTSGCSGSDSVIVANSTLAVSCAGTNISCNGISNGTASVNASGGTNSYQYLWSNGATTASLSGLPPGTYTVTVTDRNGCTKLCSVTLLNGPSLTPAISCNRTICAGQFTTLDAGAGYVHYQWSTGATIRKITATTANTYFVTVTDANGCTGKDSVTILVLPLPSVSFSGLAASYNVSAAAVTLAGSPSNGTFSGPGISGNKFNPALAGVGGPYTITYSSTNANGCSNSYSRQTTVTGNCIIPAQPGSIITGGGTAKVCPGESKTYSIAAIVGATSYTWAAPAGASITSGQGSKIVVVQYTNGFMQNGNLSVIAVSACGNSTPCKLPITRNTAPALPSVITGINVGTCQLAAVPYSVVNVPGNSYMWAFNTANASIVSGQGSNAVSAKFYASFASGSITVKATNGCGTSSVRSLAIKAIPNKPTAIAGSNPVCQNSQNVKYSISPVASAINYNWISPVGSHIKAGGIMSVANSLVSTYNAVTVNFGLSAGTVQVRANNACGSSAYVSKTISIACREEGVSLLDMFNFICYPIPAKAELNVAFYSDQDSKNSIVIRDILGKAVLNQAGQSAIGENSFKLDVSTLASGLYSIEVVNGDQKSIQKILIE